MSLISLRKKSLCHLLRVVSKYEKGSGAKLNTAQYEAMWLGRWRANSLKWVNKPRILGVFFSIGLVDIECVNWKVKLDKRKQVLGQ